MPTSCRAVLVALAAESKLRVPKTCGCSAIVYSLHLWVVLLIATKFLEKYSSVLHIFGFKSDLALDLPRLNANDYTAALRQI